MMDILDGVVIQIKLVCQNFLFFTLEVEMSVALY